MLSQVKVFYNNSFDDHRGSTYTIWQNFGMDFCLDKVISGSIGCTRGFHGDNITWKYITCLHGNMDLVLLDPKTKETQSFYLSNKNKICILVPPGIANAHQGLSEYIMFYKWTEPYDQSIQFSINPSFYGWKYEPILSDRDINSISIQDYKGQ